MFKKNIFDTLGSRTFLDVAVDFHLRMGGTDEYYKTAVIRRRYLRAAQMWGYGSKIAEQYKNLLVRRQRELNEMRLAQGKKKILYG